MGRYVRRLKRRTKPRRDWSDLYPQGEGEGVTSFVRPLTSSQWGINKQNTYWSEKCRSWLCFIDQIPVNKEAIVPTRGSRVYRMRSVTNSLGSIDPARVEQMCSEAVVKLVYSPPYSPDLNPIEETFTELKSFIRRYWQTYEDNPIKESITSLNGMSTCWDQGLKARRALPVRRTDRRGNTAQLHVAISDRKILCMPIGLDIKIIHPKIGDRFQELIGSRRQSARSSWIYVMVCILGIDSLLESGNLGYGSDRQYWRDEHSRNRHEIWLLSGQPY
jgi:hypothetical protein